MQKDFLGKVVRQRRPADKNGNCRDSAKVTIIINGVKTVYSLGRWGSPEADAEFRRLAASFYSGALTAPHEELTISAVYNEWLDLLTDKPKTSDSALERAAIFYSLEILPDFPVSQISCDKLNAFQQYLISIASDVREKIIDPQTGEILQRGKKVWSRQYINKLFNTWKRILRHGIHQGMLPYSFLEALNTFPGISSAKSTLKEREPVEAVPDSVVQATLPFLTPTVSDMVKLIRGACMRPSEACQLRCGDIDQTGDIWYLKTKHHKTARFGYKRFIAFGPAEKNILQQRMQGKSEEDYIFSPGESMQEQWAMERAARRSRVQPSQVLRASRAAERKMERFRPFWTTQALGLSIRHALQRAKAQGVEIPHWTLYQLRHAAYTENSYLYGPEIAGKIAGHNSPDLARVYDHSRQQVSLEKAAQRPAWWDKPKTK